MVRLAGGCVLVGLLLAAVLAPAVVGAGLLTASAADQIVRIDPAALRGELPGVTTLTDRAGNPIATWYSQYRIPVTADQIAPTMKAALVSIEDRRFYQENGIDPAAKLRALLSDSTGGTRQGGSTIAEQFVKNYLINVVDRNDPAARARDRADTLTRKIGRRSRPSS
jgi:membrane peptidoglycan carboxypeptidase